MMMEKKFFTKEMYDTILCESEHFTVVPSLGSLIEGWVLIAPKEETLNFSLLNEKKYSDLEHLINVIKSFQRTIFDNTIIFEHGPANKCSKTGCGVDYAHLHLVPCEYNLIDGIQSFLKLDYKWHEIQDISEISNINTQVLDYLYFRTQKDQHFITLKEEFPSQIFRQVIAHYKGIPNRYNWREFPEYDTIIGTITEFEKMKVCHEY